MARISKGFAIATAVLGALAFGFGLGTAICSFNLTKKIRGFSIVTSNYYDDYNITLRSNYWWGGLFYVLPGIIGITVGCTRNVCAMVFYLVTTLISMICSVAVSGLVAVIMVAWAVVDNLRRNNRCHSVPYSIYDYTKSCVCTDFDGNTITINNMDCDQVGDIQSSLSTLVVLASISSIIAFVASYMSCCSLCNKESDTPTAIIIQPGAGNYQPPTNIVVTNTTSNMQQQSYAPQPQYGFQQPGAPYGAPPPHPGYIQQPDYAQPPPGYVPTHDQARLVKNEVI